MARLLLRMILTVAPYLVAAAVSVACSDGEGRVESELRSAELTDRESSAVDAFVRALLHHGDFDSMRVRVGHLAPPEALVEVWRRDHIPIRARGDDADATVDITITADEGGEEMTLCAEHGGRCREISIGELRLVGGRWKAAVSDVGIGCIDP